MKCAPRPSWIFRVALACTAMAFVLFLGAYKGDRMAHVADRAVSAKEGASRDRASVRLATTMRAAWQRGGGRRSQRTTSAHISGGVRTPGIFAWSLRDGSSGVSIVEHFEHLRRDVRLGSAPTRAPPTNR